MKYSRLFLILLCVCGLFSSPLYASSSIQSIEDSLNNYAPFPPCVPKVRVRNLRVKGSNIHVYTNHTLSCLSLSTVQLSHLRKQISLWVLGNEKGKVTETAIVRGLDKTLNEEALRVVRKLKFKPARQGKKKVKYEYDVTFPIRHGKVSFLTAPTVDM